MEENAKKQVPLWRSPEPYAVLAAQAEEDFRPVNGQIEYLLSQCVCQRREGREYVGTQIDEPLEPGQ